MIDKIARLMSSYWAETYVKGFKIGKEYGDESCGKWYAMGFARGCLAEKANQIMQLMDLEYDKEDIIRIVNAPIAGLLYDIVDSGLDTWDEEAVELPETYFRGDFTKDLSEIEITICQFWRMGFMRFYNCCYRLVSEKEAVRYAKLAASTYALKYANIKDMKTIDDVNFFSASGSNDDQDLDEEVFLGDLCDKLGEYGRAAYYFVHAAGGVLDDVEKEIVQGSPLYYALKSPVSDQRSRNILTWLIAQGYTNVEQEKSYQFLVNNFAGLNFVEKGCEGYWDATVKHEIEDRMQKYLEEGHSDRELYNKFFEVFFELLDEKYPEFAYIRREAFEYFAGL